MNLGFDPFQWASDFSNLDCGCQSANAKEVLEPEHNDETELIPIYFDAIKLGKIYKICECDKFKDTMTGGQKPADTLGDWFGNVGQVLMKDELSFSIKMKLLLQEEYEWIYVLNLKPLSKTEETLVTFFNLKPETEPKLKRISTAYSGPLYAPSMESMKSNNVFRCSRKRFKPHQRNLNAIPCSESVSSSVSVIVPSIATESDFDPTETFSADESISLKLKQTQATRPNAESSHTFKPRVSLFEDDNSASPSPVDTETADFSSAPIVGKSISEMRNRWDFYCSANKAVSEQLQLSELSEQSVRVVKKMSKDLKKIKRRKVKLERKATDRFKKSNLLMSSESSSTFPMLLN